MSRSFRDPNNMVHVLYRIEHRGHNGRDLTGLCGTTFPSYDLLGKDATTCLKCLIASFATR